MRHGIDGRLLTGMRKGNGAEIQLLKPQIEEKKICENYKSCPK